MRRAFIVEAIAISLMADGVNAFGQVHKAVLRIWLRWLPVGVIGRIGRVLREGMQDVREHQFLMLLLVIEPNREDAEDRRQGGGARLADEPLDRAIAMRAIFPD